MTNSHCDQLVEVATEMWGWDEVLASAVRLLRSEASLLESEDEWKDACRARLILADKLADLMPLARDTRPATLDIQKGADS